MEALLQWGIDLILAIQQIHGPALDSIFRAITFMGEEEFYLLLLPLLFWCIDSRLGACLAILLLFSSYLNADLKDLFQQPRPFNFNPNVQLAYAEGFGLPSGHAQSSMIAWATIATWTRKTWFWVAAIVLIVLIGFSRVYLGVHFPTDVLVGWSIGAALLGLYLALQPKIGNRLAQLSLCLQILLALAIPIVLFLIHPVADTAAIMGALAGVGVGLTLRHQYISLNISGTWWHCALRFLIGIAVVFALYLGLKWLFPSDGLVFYHALLFLGYGIIGLWVSLGAPWLFRILRLAPKTE